MLGWITGKEFLDYMSESQLLKKDCIPSSQLMLVECTSEFQP